MPDQPAPPSLQEPPSEREPPEERSALRWLKRLGVGGFLFFFVKGLLWLIVPGLLVFFGC